ncbi:KLH10 protein, partial [Podargus strigoides]|nr:KLH10 protein [Podargus strigoides]
MGETSGAAGQSLQRDISALAWNIFNELRLEGQLCDVTIIAEGTKFRAHKIVLCTCSEYFRVLFTSSWNNADRRVYNIPGICSAIMQLIIEYAYTNTLPITADNAEDLLAAGDQFHITGIVRMCCEFFQSQLCLENCIGIWRITDYYCCPDLREAASLFILHHFEELAKVSAEFLELPVNELIHIIEKDELNTKEEAAVFEAILKWIAHAPRARRQHVAVLLSKVRLALLQVEYFMNNVKAHEYVKDNEECKALIIDTLTEMYSLYKDGQPSAFTNPLSRPRLPYALLFAIGGWSGRGPTNTVETYDSRADQWLNVTNKQESPIAYHGTAYLKGFIYVIGGFDGLNYFSSSKRFDPLKKTWQEVAPMHWQRCYVSVAVLHGFIYVMGGFDGHARLSTAERYEPETNQWTLIAPMQERRSDASATTLQEKVYICGGFNGSECLTTAEVYDPTTNQWTAIAPMNSSRSGLGVAAYGNEVYVVGGFNGVSRLRSVEAYNPFSDTWRSVPSMFSQRSNFGIGVVDDLLLVVGGFDGFTTTFEVECYSATTNDWYDVQDMGINRSALSCCVVPALPNVRDYIVGRD